MGNLEKIDWYLGMAICVVGRNNRDGTFYIHVGAPDSYTIYEAEYTDEVNFTADLRSIRCKFAALDDFFNSGLKDG